MAITIKAARVNAGLTQKEAAQKLGVSENVVSNWERGLTVPRIDQIPAIEAAYGLSYNQIRFFMPKDNGLTVTE